MALSDLRRKAGIWLRKSRERQKMTFSPDAISNFRFYQFKAATAAFFHERLGKTDIRVSDTPHFRLAAACAGTDPLQVAEAERYYTDYLKASWATDDDALLRGRVEAFKQHFDACRAQKAVGNPILTRLGSGPDYFVVDGNHRTAMACALGYDIEADVWPADLAFLRFSYMKEFYGTGSRNIPYQSLFVNAEEVIPGRRKDAMRRLAMIPPEVLDGATILDVASNVGMSSVLSRSFGAVSSLGLEISPKMVDVASRFSMFNGTYPDTRFRTFDIDRDILDEEHQFDTGFFFSIIGHLRNPQNLHRIAEKNILKHVVFEGHPGDTEKDYENFFSSGLFQEVSKIGELPESRFNDKPRRILWVCRKK